MFPESPVSFAVGIPSNRCKKISLGDGLLAFLAHQINKLSGVGVLVLFVEPKLAQRSFKKSITAWFLEIEIPHLCPLLKVEVACIRWISGR